MACPVRPRAERPRRLRLILAEIGSALEQAEWVTAAAARWLAVAARVRLAFAA